MNNKLPQEIRDHPHYKILLKLKCANKYYRNVAAQYENPIEHIKEQLNKESFFWFISCSFVWNVTPEKRYYWSNIANTKNPRGYNKRPFNYRAVNSYIPLNDFNKLHDLATKQNISHAEVVRKAINYYLYDRRT